jgi:hypothetical protein
MTQIATYHHNDQHPIMILVRCFPELMQIEILHIFSKKKL